MEDINNKSVLSLTDSDFREIARILGLDYTLLSFSSDENRLCSSGPYIKFTDDDGKSLSIFTHPYKIKNELFFIKNTQLSNNEILNMSIPSHSKIVRVADFLRDKGIDLLL